MHRNRIAPWGRKIAAVIGAVVTFGVMPAGAQTQPSELAPQTQPSALAPTVPRNLISRGVPLEEGMARIRAQDAIRPKASAPLLPGDPRPVSRAPANPQTEANPAADDATRRSR